MAKSKLPTYGIIGRNFQIIQSEMRPSVVTEVCKLSKTGDQT